ncbi:MAG: glycosyltransferase family 39 protein [Gaiellales bacterium]
MGARLRAFLARNWPSLLAAAATVGYGIAILGFGLDFRPLHNDEGVTLGVASEQSVADVLRTAVDVRHGPPLHYLLVHLSLQWRMDVLGLRLPSAVLGIAAVPISYGAGRELLGKPGGAAVAVVVATSPIVVHLGQFARGYTAMIAAAFGSLWILMVFIRRRRWWLVPLYAVSALLLVAAHPFGLFALASELVLLAMFTLGREVARWRADPRTLIAPAVALATGLAAFLLLRHVYAPLQNKYRVGQGGAVVHLGSTAFWGRLGEHVSGTSIAPLELLLAAAVVAGVVVLWLTNKRAGIVATVWLVLPLVLLSILTAASTDFAPERHLSFLLPGYALALAGLVVEVARRLPRWGAVAWVAVACLLLVPAVWADQNDLGNFDSSLRNASLALASRFNDHDVLLTTAGVSQPGEDSRLYGAYAALAGPNDSPLAEWRRISRPYGCALVIQAQQRANPQAVWMLARPHNPQALAAGLRRAGASATVYGSFVLARAPVPLGTPRNALYVGYQLWTAAVRAQPGVHDFRRMVRLYRAAYHRDGLAACR